MSFIIEKEIINFKSQMLEEAEQFLRENINEEIHNRNNQN